MWFPTANFVGIGQIPGDLGIERQRDLACPSQKRLRASASVGRLAAASSLPQVVSVASSGRDNPLEKAKIAPSAQSLAFSSERNDDLAAKSREVSVGATAIALSIAPLALSLSPTAA